MDIRDVYVSSTWTFEKEVARLNKKAARIGVSAIKLINLGKETHTRTVVISGGDGEGEADVKHVPVEVTHYQIELPEPADRTWEVLAKITPVEGKPFVESMKPGTDLEPWKDTDPQHCDHCNTRRARNVSYVVRNTQTDKFMQLGRNCFGDYIGKDTLAALEFRSVVEMNLGGDDEGFFPRGCGSIETAEVLRCVALAEALFSIDGWFNNKKDEYDGRITVEGTHRIAGARVRGGLRSCGQNPHTHEAMGAMGDVDLSDDKTSPIWTRAAALVARLQSEEIAPDDEFGQTLKNLADYTHIPSQKASLAAYIGQYLRQRDARALSEARKATMTYRGTVGARETFENLTVVRCPSYETDFGTVYVNTFADTDGNELVWKTGSRNYGVGDKVTLKGTVKAHNEFRGTPQTILTRCKEIEAQWAGTPPINQEAK